MKSVALIPVKNKSSRLENKNFLDFHGNPLYEHFFKKLYPANPFDEVYVNTDSEEVKRKAKEYNFSVIDRPDWLSEDSANGNDLLLYDYEIVDADYYFQLFVTAPCLLPETIDEAHYKLINHDSADSIFTCTENYTFYWTREGPLNYDPTVLPRTQDMEPIYQESTGLYGISKNGIRRNNCRIGSNPIKLVIDELQAIDIDEAVDLDIAKEFWKKLES